MALKAFRCVAIWLCMSVSIVWAQAPAPEISAAGVDSIRIRFVEVDFRAVVQAIAPYLDRPVLFGALPSGKVTLETPRPVARRDLLGLLQSIAEGQGAEVIADSMGTLRVRTRLDRPRPGGASGPGGRIASGPGGPPELFVIHLKHARAIDVSATVNALYGRAVAFGELGGRSSPLPEQLQQNMLPPSGQAAPVANPVIGRVAALSGDITLVPDASTNSLLVRASRSDFELVQAAVTELDVRPTQVLIEVYIAEVKKNSNLQFGVELNAGERSVGRQGTTVSGATQGLGLGDLVLRAMHLGGEDVTATLRASAARGDAVIISRPVLLAANNEKATINVGSQRPFVQVSRSLPTNTPQRDQVVQYKDVGTTLTVRPTISGNGYVTLDVTQEVNSATNETQFDAPIISTRSVQTKLLIRDSQTVILGGLTDRQREATSGGVPFLSRIPLLGGLFGRTSRSTTESELFLFITPRILRTDEDADRVTAPRQGTPPR